MAISPSLADVVNSYRDTGGTSYLTARGSKPTDFTEFRESSYNNFTESPPNFTIVRLIDGTHALAGGQMGMLYRGELSGSQWTWTATMDEDKDFVAHRISDICVVDSQNAWACTGVDSSFGGGTISKTTDGGVTWQVMRTAPRDPVNHHPLPADGLYQVSFYDTNNGWCVGRRYSTPSGAVVLKTADGGVNWSAVTPPSGLSGSVSAVVAVDAGHVWIGGYTGVYFSSNGGRSWTQQSSEPYVRKLAVRNVVGSYKGWAVGDGGRILHTTDGVNWHLDTNPAGTATMLDIAMYDATHAAVAYGQARFLLWHPSGSDPCGGHWELESSDLSFAKDSVAVDGSGNCIAASGKTIRVGIGGPMSWSESYSIPDAHWRMEFLVCRLDGFPNPIDQTTNIPLDVKGMINRSLASDGNGSGKFVLDYSTGYVNGGYGEKMSWGRPNVEAVVGTQNVVCDPGNQQDETYLVHQTDVMGYFSGGRIYDWKADEITTWGRPFSTWKNGGVGMFGSDLDGNALRDVNYFFALARGVPHVPSDHLLRFRLDMWQNISQTYTNHWLGLYSPTGELLARSNFQTDHTAIIDLSSIQWPTNGNPYAEIHFADDDPTHAGEYISVSSTKNFQNPIIADDQQTGVDYTVKLSHSRSSELIREGASGSVGHANDVGDAMHEHYYILPRYASGFTWAESTWLGFQELGSQELVLGDPLMAPYAQGLPTVSFVSPSEGASVSGFPTVEVNAQAVGNATGIARVDFWLSKMGTGGYDVYKHIGTDTQAPFTCTFDSTVFLDGTYTLRAVAYENNPQHEAAEAARQIVIANTTGPTTLEITEPAGTEISDSVTVVAAASNPSVVTRVDFWILTPSGLQLLASGTTFSCNLDTTVYADGASTLYAQAYWTDGGQSGDRWCRKEVTIGNPGVVGIAEPATDGLFVSGLVNVSIAVSAVGPPAVSKVELWLSGEGVPEYLAGTDYSAPYLITADTTGFTDGTYTLRAVAYKSPDDKPVVNNGFRTIVTSNTHVRCNIHEARTLTNGSAVLIETKPVVSGTSETMEGAFYIEEPDRSAGVRVAWTGVSVPTGKQVSLFGIVGNAATGERQIAAERIWIGVDATPVQPLGLNNRDLGGAAPSDEPYTNGITGAAGLYNIGLLVRTWGKVTYIGSNFIYIDDGSNLQDGNLLAGPIIVPLDGSTIPTVHPPAKGVRVNCGNLNKPGIGDYVAITGANSTEMIGSNIVRNVRLRSQQDLTFMSSYQRCSKTLGGYYETQDLTPLPAGAKVRMIDAYVESNSGNSFGVLHTEDWIYPLWIWSDIMATTQLSYGQTVTITGTVEDDGGGGYRIRADAIYLGGSEYGALSVGHDKGGSSNDGTAGGGPFKPWPSPTAEEILASDWFNKLYNQVGAIGWALSQPDGAVVDLPGEEVVYVWYDGSVLGLKESFEPIQNAPKLVLVLDKAVKGLDPWMSAIDIVGGTLITLKDGQRAVVKPKAVYVYTDAKGRYLGMPVPPFKGLVESGAVAAWPDWPWKVQIAP